MKEDDTTPMCEVTVHVAAPAEKVWDLVSDLPRMGEWSPETKTVEWLGGATGPVVGAKFKGVNARGSKKWSTAGRITEAERGRVVSWDVTAAGFGVAQWRYQLTPTDDGGCDVTEQMFDHRNRLAKFAGGFASGVKDRQPHNAEGMKATLQNLKAAAEGSVSPDAG